MKLRQLYNEIKLVKQKNSFKYEIGEKVKSINNKLNGELLILKRGTYEMFNSKYFNNWSKHSVVDKYKDGNWYLIKYLQCCGNRVSIYPEVFIYRELNEVKNVPIQLYKDLDNDIDSLILLSDKIINKYDQWELSEELGDLLNKYNIYGEWELNDLISKLSIEQVKKLRQELNDLYNDYG